MKQFDIYGLGAALVDTEIEVDDDFLTEHGIEKGLMTLVDESRQHQLMTVLDKHLVHSKRASGGSAANSIIAAGFMGANNYYSCKVANDDNGWFYLDDLKAAGVTASFSKDKVEGITGKCLVLITPDAERTMNTFLGVSETLSEQNLDLDALAASKFLYFEGYLVTSDTGRQAAITARQHADKNQVKTAISLSDPGIVAHFKDGLKTMLGEGVDLIFCNYEEALSLTETDSINDAYEALKAYGKQFAITLGNKGSVLFDGEKRIDIAAHNVTAIDTNGAGDAYAGAFLYALSQGCSFTDAGNLASKTAAMVVSQYGPRLDKAGYQQVLQALKQA